MKKNILIALLFGSCFMLQAQIGIGTPSPDPTAVLELKSISKGFLLPRITTNQRNTIVSPATGLVIYNSDKNCLEWYNGTVWYSGCGIQESSGGSAVVSGYSCTAASTGIMTAGTALSGVTQTITATVAAAGSYSISAIANGISFTGSGIFTVTGPQDIVLTATGTPIVEETSNFVLNTTANCNFSRIILAAPVGPVGGNAICDGTVPTVVLPIISSTGKVWMDRNLGASRAGTSSSDYQAYGCLYQWGRGNDGHASINWTSSTIGTAINGMTTTLATTDSPGALFIINDDWRSTQNDALWQGLNGVNNPCPTGYRVPTDAELTAEFTAYSITNYDKAYSSIFKFVVAGGRDYHYGLLGSTGTYGFYWSSTVSDTDAFYHSISSSGGDNNINYRGTALSVRCLKG